MPSNCAGGQVSKLNLDTQGPPYETEASSTEASYTTPTGATGCANVPFNPEITVTATGAKLVDSPEATTVDVGIPFDPNAPIANSYLKVAKVTLPEGMGINPSAGNTITSCSDAQFHYHEAAAVECPAASQIGTVGDRNAVVAEWVDHRRGLHRRAAEERAGRLRNRRTVPDLHLRPLGPLRRQRPTRGQGLPERVDRSADRRRAGKPAGHVPRLPPQLQRRRQRGAHLGTDLWDQHDHDRIHPVVGKPRSQQAVHQHDAHERPGWRHLPAQPRRPQVRAELQCRLRFDRGGQVQPIHGPHRAERWRTGAEGRQRDPAEGPRRPPGRDPLLRGSRTRRRGGEQRQSAAGETELLGRKRGRHGDHCRGQRRQAAEPVGDGLPRRSI